MLHDLLELVTRETRTLQKSRLQLYRGRAVGEEAASRTAWAEEHRQAINKALMCMLERYL